jgi:Zn-dependent protease with chaperone function
MMFNNIIYFIVVLLIFNIHIPDTSPGQSFPASLALLFLTWVLFALYCRWSYAKLGRWASGNLSESRWAGQYQRLTVRLSMLAIGLFALAVYLFHLKFWIQQIPGFQRFSVCQSLLALSLFFGYLSTIWYHGFPVYRRIFDSNVTRSSFVGSNLRINIPILFPWFFLSLLFDLLAFTPFAKPGGFMTSLAGQLLLFASFLCLLIVVMPGILQYWWQCKPLVSSEKAVQLRTFLEEKGFRYRNLLRWPLFEGKMLTAGIVGVLPRFRYILITPSLMEALSVDELKAVVAHEMGHAKYRHLVFYLFFFLGFMVLSYGLSDVFFYLFLAHPRVWAMFSSGGNETMNLSYLMLSIPMLIVLLIYFRYVMGFFMRHFERQADLYSAAEMGTPVYTASSLEKIALLGGKIRDLPSWHHFSIRERVDCLWRMLKDPGLLHRQNRWVRLWFLVYLLVMAGLGYFLNFSPMKDRLAYGVVEHAIQEQIEEDPENVDLYQSLAMLYHQMEKHEAAIRSYEEILARDPDRAVALNNLAWLLVTVPEERLRDNRRALALAERAVRLERTPVFLDTLAEAYYANGQIAEAVKAGQEALALAEENRKYYEGQVERFRGSM